MISKKSLLVKSKQKEWGRYRQTTDSDIIVTDSPSPWSYFSPHKHLEPPIRPVLICRPGVTLMLVCGSHAAMVVHHVYHDGDVVTKNILLM